jgi:hypothetical protein
MNEMTVSLACWAACGSDWNTSFMSMDMIQAGNWSVDAYIIKVYSLVIYNNRTDRGC